MQRGRPRRRRPHRPGRLAAPGGRRRRAAPAPAWLRPVRLRHRQDRGGHRRVRRRCSATRWSATWWRRGPACGGSARAIAWWRRTTCRAAGATTAAEAASRCAASSRPPTSIPAGSPSTSGFRAPNVRHATFRIPDHLGDEEASFVEPLACCLRAVDRARVEPGDTVVVIGLGSIGCLFAQLLKRAGAVVVGVDPARRACGPGAGPRRRRDRRCRARGAGRARAERGAGRRPRHRHGGGADVLPWATARHPRRRCRPLFRGRPGDTLPLPLGTLYHRELTVTSTYSSSPADAGRARSGSWPPARSRSTRR